MGFHHIGQAGLELLTLGDPPASAYQSAEITGVSHLVWPGTVSVLHSGPTGVKTEVLREGAHDLNLWESPVGHSAPASCLVPIHPSGLGADSSSREPPQIGGLLPSQPDQSLPLAPPATPVP